MPALRTSLVALVVGGGALTAGVLASTATAAPAPVSALTAATDGSDDTTDRPGRGGIRAWWEDLTDAQRACMEDADLRRPVGPLDDAERATLREQVTAAADACGVELPFARARALRDSLTDEQRQCLDDAGLTRPVGPMTKEQRRRLRSEVRSAAESCGVTLQARTPATAS